MRGGRAFTSRGQRSDNDYGSKFRGQNNTYRDSNASGGRFGGGGNKRRFSGGGSDSFGNNKSALNRSRSRYDHRSPDRYAHGHNERSSRTSRDNSAPRKRSRHDGNGGSRRDLSSNLSDSRFDRHAHSNGDGGRGSSSYHRGNSNRRPSPLPKANHSSARRGIAEKPASSPRGKERVGRKNSAPLPGFSKKNSRLIRENKESTARSVRRSKLVSAARSNIIRRRLAPLRNRDAIRRAKIAHMRSSIKKREAAKKSKVGGGDENEKAEKKSKSDDEEKLTADKDEEKKKSGIKSTANDTQGNGKSDKAEDNEAESKDDEAMDADDQKLEDNGDNDDKSANDKDEKLDAEKALDDDGAKADSKSSKKKGDDLDKRSSKKFVRLWCAHCRVECITFKDYNNHLHSRAHKSVLGRFGLRQKTKLARMRLSQRNAQRKLEEKSKDTEKQTPQFCLLCRLNYRSPKEEHQASEAHRKMKQFLMPYCEVCRISFKSPMTYEIHRCSIEHLKRKANKSDDKESDVDDSDETELQVDLDSFMTVDSVGDVDGSELSLNDESDEHGSENAPKSSENAQAEINVGSEHVKKIEVYYCDLCRFYLPHLEDPEAALQKHCSTRNHLRAYLRYKENQSLKITAEMIHRRDNKEKHSKQDSKAGESDSKRPDSAARTDDEAMDKAWEDTDKDCDGNEQVENNNEDEDDTSIERYDRFKNSEKADDTDDIAETDKDNGTATEPNGIEANAE